MSASLRSIILVLACCGAVHAGAGDDGLVGVVTAGPDRQPIANASIALRAGAHELRTQTDAAGSFAFAELTHDVAYTLTVVADGLKTFSRSPIVVRAGAAARIDVQMQLADTHFSVDVTGATPVQRPADIAQQVDARDIDALPSITRAVTKYALLDPHVRQVIGLGADFQDASRLSFNAASYRHTGYMLDGISTYDWIYGTGPQVAVSPSAVRDINVLTGQYPAQYGLSTAGLLSISTASGGDSLRGEVAAFERPDAWQSRPPLSTFDVPNSRHDIASRIGGPIRAGRTYVFASYEGATQDRGAFLQSPQPGFFIGHSREQQALARLDHRLTATHTLAVRFNGSESTTDNANDRVAGFNQPSFGRRSHAPSLGGQATERATAGALVSELRVSFVAYMPDSATPLQPSVQIVRPNYATEGFSTSNWVRARTLQAGYQLTIDRGRHDLTLGGDVGRLTARDVSDSPLGIYTFAPGAPQLDEHPLTFAQTFGTVDLEYGQTQGSAFVQDEIQLRPSLTATLGLRYEAQSITDSRTNFAPRLGLAWDVSGDGRTTLRGGAGMFYDQYYMYLTRRYLTLGPRSPQRSYTWSWGDPGFPVYPSSFNAAPVGRAAGARDIMIPDDRLLNPYSRQLSLALERQIGRGMALQVAGLDSHTFRQMRVNDINHPAPFIRTGPNQVRTPQVATQSRPSTAYDGIAVRDIAAIENTAESLYRSIDLGLTRRGASGTQFGVHYVRSWSTAYSMFFADANSGVPNEWTGHDEDERGPSDFHQPHRMVANAAIELPYGINAAVVAVAASGLPVNPITGRDNNGDSYTVDRPVGLGRNSFRGPAQVNLDLSIAKRLRLAARLQSEVRLEIFNLTDRENFLRVNNVYGEGPAPLPTFLTPVAGITNADPSRQLQLVLKVQF